MEFEKKLKRLEEIVQKMEKGELALEESLRLFEEGVKLSRECQKELQSAEQQVEKLLSVNADGSAITEPFIVTENSSSSTNG
ncbi:MAG: exodeoxyribonuclease VII small subunit [Bdellovibrionaceae bacterium]|nr:exodeoxyribonuclease VII small subunit [Pseudobdellovibrionaceae bacterium]MDW8189379.1 exodeoxyribonuclease VII small subunit [Pseudobdellovibrionaceae bacterium]